MTCEKMTDLNQVKERRKTVKYRKALLLRLVSGKAFGMFEEPRE